MLRPSDYTAGAQLSLDRLVEYNGRNSELDVQIEHFVCKQTFTWSERGIRSTCSQCTCSRFRTS